MGGPAQLGTLGGHRDWEASGMFRSMEGGRKLGRRVEDRPAGPGRRSLLLQFLKSGAASQIPPGLLLSSDSTSALHRDHM